MKLQNAAFMGFGAWRRAWGGGELTLLIHDAENLELHITTAYDWCV